MARRTVTLPTTVTELANVNTVWTRKSMPIAPEWEFQGPPTPPSGKTSIKIDVTEGHGGFFLENPVGAVRIVNVTFSVGGKIPTPSAVFNFC